jgi:hypothetical protein
MNTHVRALDVRDALNGNVPEEEEQDGTVQAEPKKAGLLGFGL